MLKPMLVGIASLAIAVSMAPSRPALGAPPPPQPKMPAAFTTCAACHNSVRGARAGVGPNLYGVMGAKAGARPGFAYSAALKKSGVVWNKATVARYIANPAAVAPGTTMPNPGIANARDRAAIVTYLAALK